MMNKFYTILTVCVALVWYRSVDHHKLDVEIGSIHPKAVVSHHENGTKKLAFLFTNDMHSAVDSFGMITSIISQKKEELRKEGFAVLTLDAGDWYSGTMFDMLGPNPQMESMVPELEFFAANRYDAILFGNHAFDNSELGLGVMLDKAERMGIDLDILAANMNIESESPLAKFVDGTLSKHVKISSTHLLKVMDNGLRVVIVGTDGPDSAISSSGTRSHISLTGFSDDRQSLEFSSFVDLMNRKLEEAKADNPDVVVLLFHGGPPEDTTLLQQLRKDLLPDVVIAAHTHDTIFTHVHAGDEETFIPVAQCGCHAMHLGVLETVVSKTGKVGLLETTVKKLEESGHVCFNDQSYELKDMPVHDIMASIESWKSAATSSMSRAFDEVVFSQRVGSPNQLFFDGEKPTITARKVATGVRDALNEWFTEHDQKPIDLYMTCPECIRRPIQTLDGENFRLTFSDVYELVGISKFNPLSSFHVRKQDLFAIMELVVVIAPLLVTDEFELSFSNNLQYKVSRFGVPFLGLCYDAMLNGKEYQDWPDLIKVAMPNFIGRYIWKVEALSFGILSSIARDENGNHITYEESLLTEAPPEFELLATYFLSQSDK